MTLLDATYKTTKYDLSMFFLCVKTNVGYSVVGEFVIQSETSQQIAEALLVLKGWNPNWNPPFFIIDYSEAELSAIEEVFPSTKVYLCDFHREQAWERWCKVIKTSTHMYMYRSGEQRIPQCPSLNRYSDLHATCAVILAHIQYTLTLYMHLFTHACTHAHTHTHTCTHTRTCTLQIRKNGLSDQQAHELLDLLRDCANAPPVLEIDNQGKLPNDKLQPDHYFLLAVDYLKKSDVWKNNINVRNWLNTTWLPLPQVLICTFLISTPFFMYMYICNYASQSTMQRWARAYRDSSYHAAVDTNNGTEAQNKLLKYSYLPKRKKLSLSSIIVLLLLEYLPDMHKKYLFENFKMTSNYRQYKDFVPNYLHDRPRSVIKHCLERKSNGQKYAKEDVSCIDNTNGTFQVKGTGNTQHKLWKRLPGAIVHMQGLA